MLRQLKFPTALLQYLDNSPISKTLPQYQQQCAVILDNTPKPGAIPQFQRNSPTSRTICNPPLSNCNFPSQFTNSEDILPISRVIYQFRGQFLKSGDNFSNPGTISRIRGQFLYSKAMPRIQCDIQLPMTLLDVKTISQFRGQLPWTIPQYQGQFLDSKAIAMTISRFQGNYNCPGQVRGVRL